MCEIKSEKKIFTALFTLRGAKSVEKVLAKDMLQAKLNMRQDFVSGVELKRSFQFEVYACLFVLFF